MSLSFKFRKDPCIRWGDIQLLVTMYISYYTLNFSQFSPENFDFFGTPSYWYFLISSVQWQFLTRRKKPHAISINTERVRSPRVQTFWWHSSNRDVRPGEFQPYVSVKKKIPKSTWKVNWRKEDDQGKYVRSIGGRRMTKANTSVTKIWLRENFCVLNLAESRSQWPEFSYEKKSVLFILTHDVCSQPNSGHSHIWI